MKTTSLIIAVSVVLALYQLGEGRPQLSDSPTLYLSFSGDSGKGDAGPLPSEHSLGGCFSSLSPLTAVVVLLECSALLSRACSMALYHSTLHVVQYWSNRDRGENDTIDYCAIMDEWAMHNIFFFVIVRGRWLCTRERKPLQHTSLKLDGKNPRDY